MTSISKVEPLDRFAVPTAALRVLPPQVAADVKEGIRAANARCSRAATSMLRRALEGACTHAGAERGNLYDRIEYLRKEGVLTALQAASAHAIRAFANKYGAHPDDDFLDEVTDEEIETAVKITVSVVEGLARRKAVK